MDLTPEITREQRCRCGHPRSSKHPHPCHGQAHRCRQPATQRFYGPRLVALAGMQAKLEVSDTWACDTCWIAYQALAAEHRAAAAR